jgi:hypothetical protein
MKHIVITRFSFSSNDLFKRYFDIMKYYYIPSLSSQTNKDFELGLITSKKHFDHVNRLIDDNIKTIRFDNKQEYKEYVVNNDTTLQTRHDSDDFMNKSYVNKIQLDYLKYFKIYDDFVLSFQPTKIDHFNQKEYTHSRKYDKHPSMFSTLIQKKASHSILDVDHDSLHKLTKNIIYIPETYVKLVIHNNKLSKLKDTDVFIKNLKD